MRITKAETKLPLFADKISVDTKILSGSTEKLQEQIRQFYIVAGQKCNIKNQYHPYIPETMT